MPGTGDTDTVATVTDELAHDPATGAARTRPDPHADRWHVPAEPQGGATAAGRPISQDHNAGVPPSGAASQPVQLPDAVAAPRPPADIADVAAESEPPQQPVRLRLIVSLVLAVLVGAAGGSAATSPSPYALTAPGPTPSISDALTGDIVDEQFGAHGELLMTTVAVTNLTWIAWLRARLDPPEQAAIEPAAPALPDDLPIDPYQRQMEASQETALLAAWAALGNPLPTTQVEVVHTIPGSPADAAGLQAGDVVTAADGEPITTNQQLIDAVQAAAGATLTLELTRAGATMDVHTTPDAHRNGAQLGVEITQRVDGDALPELGVDAAGIGGASAGLMFTLAYIDALSEGSLTGGYTVAGTGTIDPQGRVGPVAGTDRKIVGAAASGADVFFIPTANVVFDDSPPSSTDDELAVVAVTTLDDAIDWLCDRGADPQLCATLR